MVHANTQWLAVRCCCQPQKVLGFYRVPHGASSLRVPNRLDGGFEEFELAMMVERGDDAAVHERAIKSEQRGLDFWRAVPGFLQAVEPAPEFRRPWLGAPVT